MYYLPETGCYFINSSTSTTVYISLSLCLFLYSDRQRVHRLGSHITASDQYARHRSSCTIRRTVCGTHCTHRRHTCCPVATTGQSVDAKWSGQCGGLYVGSLHTAGGALLLLCLRLSDQRWRLPAAHGYSAWRGFAIHIRCTACGWSQSFSTELHQIGDGTVRGCDDILDEFRSHRVSQAKRSFVCSLSTCVHRHQHHLSGTWQLLRVGPPESPVSHRPIQPLPLAVP